MTTHLLNINLSLTKQREIEDGRRLRKNQWKKQIAGRSHQTEML